MISSNLLIEHQCPQCGAPATLEETDHLFTCTFCRVKSFLLSKVFRYTLPHAAPENKELIHIPYWRFKGMLFSCISSGIKNRIVDVSHQGVVSPYFPASLGLRSQTLKLRFVSPETQGRFVKPGLSYRETEQMIEERFSAMLRETIFTQSFIGDALSIIYAPFYVDNKLYDAVLNRPVSPELPEDFDASILEGGPSNWRIKFIPAMCPDCGWDLEGERDSLALDCRNCNSVWQSGKDGFMKLKFGHMASNSEQVRFLPFWRIKANISGIELDSYADLVQVANLPKVVQDQWKDVAFRFWVPAFKVRPEDFLRFGRNMTLSQPQPDWVSNLPNGNLHPVTLPIHEAVESLKTTLASFIKPPGIMYPKLPEIDIKGTGFFLAYIPFNEKGSELTQPDFRLRINKTLLAYGRHL